MAKQFIITGVVLGNLWMGGTGAYPIQKISALTRKKALTMAEQRLEMGKLTGTGDFNGNVGAMLYIECITTHVIKGKEFINKETEPVIFIGELDEDEVEHLFDYEN